MTMKEAEKKLRKTKEYFSNELAKVRGSRANPQLIEDIVVDVYGSSMPIKQIATVSVADPRLITVSCWDKNNVDAVKKAIETSELNVNPSEDGNLVRVPLPPLTEERREELVKVVKKLAEDAKVSIRHIRRDFIDSLEKESKSEDDLNRGKKQIQSLVDEANKMIEEEFEKKEEELMTI